MLVLNLYGGPGTGKSTTAAALFALCKRAGIKCELVTERAKELCYEKSPLLANQLYILAAQHRRLANLQGQVDLAITDGPLGLSHVYAAPPFDSAWWHAMVQATNATFDNYNVFLRRLKPYAAYGRGQTEDEARQLDKDILASPFIVFNKHLGATNTVEQALFQIVKEQLALRKRPDPSTGQGTPVWLQWSGGNMPVRGETYVVAELADGTTRPPAPAYALYWGYCSPPHPEQIVRWRLAGKETAAPTPPTAGEQWFPWWGGQCRMAADLVVQVALRSGTVSAPTRVRDLDWTWDNKPPASNIVRWRWSTLLQSPDSQVEQPATTAPPQWNPWPGGRSTLAPSLLVMVKTRGGFVLGPAEVHRVDWEWSSTYPQHDVVSWRLAPPEEPKPHEEPAAPQAVQWTAFAPHSGGPCPLPPHSTVQVQLLNGSLVEYTRAELADWEHNAASPGNNVVQWRTPVSPHDHAYPAAAQEPWTPWSGGPCPVEPTTVVEYRCRSSAENVVTRRACAVPWGRTLGGSTYDVEAWRAVPGQSPEVRQRVAEYHASLHFTDGWRRHQGGPLPMDHRTHTTVAARLRSGQLKTASPDSFRWNWAHCYTHAPGDVLAYKSAPGRLAGPPFPWHSWPESLPLPETFVEFETPGYGGAVLGPLRVDLLRKRAAQGLAITRWRLTQLTSTPTYVTDWQPGYLGPCPVDTASLVEVELVALGVTQPRFTTAAGNVPWTSATPDGLPKVKRWRAVPQRSVSAAPKPEQQPWQPWTGGPCPVDPETIVEVESRAGSPATGRACNFPWATRSGPENKLNIVRWRSAFPPTPAPSAARAPDPDSVLESPEFDWQPWRGGRCPVAPDVMVMVDHAKDGVVGPVAADQVVWNRYEAGKGAVLLVKRWRRVPVLPAGPERWREHGGGPCPVGPETKVDLVLAGDHRSSRKVLNVAARWYNWLSTAPRHSNHHERVIYWRLA